MAFAQMTYPQCFAAPPSVGTLENMNSSPADMCHHTSAFVDTSTSAAAAAVAAATGVMTPAVSAAAAFNVGALAAGYAACAAVDSNHHSLYAAAAYNQPYFHGLHHPVSVATDSSLYHSLAPPSTYAFKDSRTEVANSAAAAAAWRSAASYNPYDPSAAWAAHAAAASGYPGVAAYAAAGGTPLDGARRKNATRESTATLKAWLNEHIKNPYPTKGEKIMLAIITKMTLTQVSTWFANARRRLKKENKMTWAPRNRADDDEGMDADDDDGSVTEGRCGALCNSDDEADRSRRTQPDQLTNSIDGNGSMCGVNECRHQPSPPLINVPPSCLKTVNGVAMSTAIRRSTPTPIGPASACAVTPPPPSLAYSNNSVSCMLQDASSDNAVLKPRIWSLAQTAEALTPDRKRAAAAAASAAMAAHHVDELNLSSALSSSHQHPHHHHQYHPMMQHNLSAVHGLYQTSLSSPSQLAHMGPPPSSQGFQQHFHHSHYPCLSSSPEHGTLLTTALHH